jgi:hypothetical protein
LDEIFGAGEMQESNKKSISKFMVQQDAMEEDEQMSKLIQSNIL